jgi:hypothetical protein
MSANWILVAIILVAGTILIGAEIDGIRRHDEHKIDTVSELYWSLQDRLGPWAAVLAIPLAVFLAWLWHHLTYEGRKRRYDRRHRQP